MSDKDTLLSELDRLDTEGSNLESHRLDELSPPDIAALINREDHKVALAIKLHLGPIATVIGAATKSLQSGHRIIYQGAGTSGRLGVLDAAECPPTFGAEPGVVVGLLAGGLEAMFEAKEGAEDDRFAGVSDLKDIGLTAGDTLVGISASGRTPYVMAGLEYGNEIGAQTAAITCSRVSKCGAIADTAIDVSPGPEVLTGSTRMKAGSVQKMILNMISTGAMVGAGKCYGNLMVDVQATNAKLEARAIRIVMQATQASKAQSEAALQACGGSAKTAIAAILLNSSPEEAEALLAETGGKLRPLIERS